MPTLDNLLIALALVACLLAVMAIAHRAQCRTLRRLEAAQRKADIERAQEDLRRRAYARFAHLHAVKTRSQSSRGPYVILPASMSEPPALQSINTGDSDDRAAAVITTLSIPMEQQP